MNRTEKMIIRSLAWRAMDLWELINYQDQHVAGYFETIKSLLDKGWIRQREDGKLELTESAPSLKPVITLKCQECDGKGIRIQGTYFQDLLDKFLETTRDRPGPEEDFDQGYIRPVDTIGRVAFIYDRGDLEDTEIIVVGDDDLTALALAMTEMPKRVYMLDIDQRLIDYELKKAKELGLKNLEAGTWDVRKELPNNLKEKFDVFVTDPSETELAWKAFLSRAVSALRGRGSSGYFGLTRRESSLAKWRKFQGIITEMGFAITDLIKDFHVYPESQYDEGFWDTWELWKHLPVKAKHTNTDWYTSYLVRIEAVDEIKPAITGNLELSKEFYLDDESWVTP